MDAVGKDTSNNNSNQSTFWSKKKKKRSRFLFPLSLYQEAKADGFLHGENNRAYCRDGSSADLGSIVSSELNDPNNKHFKTLIEKYEKEYLQNRKSFRSNKIRTTKYTILSFLPKNLFEQFHRLANLYFLMIIGLNFVPQLGVFGKEVSMIPLIAVLCMQAFADILEDFSRWRNDKTINSLSIDVYRSSDNKYHKVKWSELLVGDIVRVVCNSVIPADLLLLHTSDEDGICFIETSNIDGETNLKQRVVVKRHWQLSSSNEFNPRDFKSIIECQTPNMEIYKFHGNIIPPDGGDKISVNNSNLLLRGCVIRNTDYVEGIVVYAGHETKAMLNNNGPRYKRSKLERRMNTDVLYCVVLLVVMCLIGAVGNGVWASAQSQIDQTELYIPPESDGSALDPALSGFFMFWTMVILLQVLIPISLYVSIELVKWAQVYMINNDIDLYHEESDTPMRCRALNITEDLGQIQYVFSDKTGTLTENQMIFRRCTVGGVDYPHAANAARIENAEPIPAYIHPDHSRHPENERLPSREDRSRQSYRRPLSGSIRPHHRRNQSTLSKIQLDDETVESDGAVMSRSVPNSPALQRKYNMSTKRPASHHRRNISAASAREVLSSIALENDKIVADEEPDQMEDPIADEDLETDVTPDPVLFEQLTSIRNPAKASPDAAAKISQEKRRILDFFINLAICNTVVISSNAEPQEPQGIKELDEMVITSPSLFPNVLKKVIPTKLTPVNGEKYRVLDTDRPGVKLENDTVSGKVHFKEVSANNSSNSTPVMGENYDRYSSEELSKIRYEAESPDEAALVYAAHAYGCVLAHRSSTGGKETVTITLPNGEGTLTFEVLFKLPFDSARKRMSVLVRDPLTGEVTLYCKGADSSILSQLATEETDVHFDIENDDVENFALRQSNSHEIVDATKKFLAAYARSGLRTLCISKRVLSDGDYREWLLKHTEAEQALENRDQLLSDSYHRIEQDLELLGATGIEDRLQDGVPETIEALRQAGIQVWVVTGDKQETAINIGYSCRLIHQMDEVIVLNAENKETLSELLRIHNKAQDEKRGVQPEIEQQTSMLNFNISFILPNSTTYPSINDKDLPALGLVIDGKTLAFALQKDVQKEFVKLARRCRSVLCCRATPLQKGEVVKLIRDELQVMTLAIGDGANDVSMIQVADVGIGLSGQEGMQAVMSSDYALAQFRFLRKLLLVHGHWNYARLAPMVLYFFYKNAAFVFLIFWFQIFCGFSGANMLEQLYLLLFNLVFTSVPPLINGVLDKDVSEEMLLKKPSLYGQGIRDELYLSRTFWINIIDAIYQSLVIFFFLYWAYIGSNVGLIEWGTVVTTAAVFVMLLHLAIETKTWTWIHWLCLIGSVVVFFAFALIYNIICASCSPPSNPYYIMETVIQTSDFWFSCLLATVVALFPRYLVRVIQSQYFANESQRERILEMTQPRSQSAGTVTTSIANSSVTSSNTYQNPTFNNGLDLFTSDRTSRSKRERRPKTITKSGDDFLDKGREAISYYGGSTPDLSSMSPYYGTHLVSSNFNHSNNVALNGDMSVDQTRSAGQAGPHNYTPARPTNDELHRSSNHLAQAQGIDNLAYHDLLNDSESDQDPDTGEGQSTSTHSVEVIAEGGAAPPYRFIDSDSSTVLGGNDSSSRRKNSPMMIPSFLHGDSLNNAAETRSIHETHFDNNGTVRSFDDTLLNNNLIPNVSVL